MGVTIMTNNTIITIGRQFGSGGHEIGNRLSERLGIPLYDYNLIRMAAQELKIDPQKAQEVDETILGRYMASAVSGTGSGAYILFMNGTEYEQPLSEQIFEMQSKLIEKLAEQSPCIFVGRCADLNEKKAWEKIKRVDRTRKAYYEEHTDREWGSIEAHQMMFNSSLMGIDGVVDALEGIYKKWEA